MSQIKVAFLLRGAVSKKSGKIATAGTLYNNSQYVNFKSTKKSIDEHIVKPNKNYTFDFFLHGWNTDLEEDLIDLYKPVNHLFENNAEYTDEINQKIKSSPIGNNGDFSQVSQFLSLHKCCNLVNSTYDIIIVYRYDLLLWKDMILDEYDVDALTINNFLGYIGDFHMITKFSNLSHLKSIYESIGPNNPPKEHKIINNYAWNIGNVPLKMDNITAGIDHEITRKLLDIYNRGNINESVLNRYGLTTQEISTYTIN